MSEQLPGGRPPGFWSKFFSGAVITIAYYVPGLPIAGAMLGAAGVDASALFGPALALPVLAAIGLSFSPARRPYGLGILAALGVAAIVLGGLCVVLLASYNSGGIE